MNTNFIYTLVGWTVTLVLSFFFIPLSANTSNNSMCIDRINLIKESKHELTILDVAVDPLLIDALIRVESSNGTVVYGDLHLGTPSVGVLQIRRIMVDDVNRILKLQDQKKQFNYDDRYSKDKSIEMFIIYVSFYAQDYLDSNEYIARIWNGGPDGYRQLATRPYWEKVDETLAMLAN